MPEAAGGSGITSGRAPKAWPAGSANRGVGAGDRVFMVTDHAHLIALNRFTGELLWDTELDDWRKNYAASSAPLPAGNLVISGRVRWRARSERLRRRYDQETGKEVWRFWTVPKPGEPGSETWQGKDIEHGGAPTWFTGSYDPALDLVYWPTGNPGKEYNGDDRQGDNLYANSIVALDRKSGKLRGILPVHAARSVGLGRDADLGPRDAAWEGRPRRLMLHASRNGFFYVFDRENGKLLLAKPFVKNLTWASGIGADGRPIKLPNQEPTPAGTKVCPSQDGATNWFSPSTIRRPALLRADLREVQHLHQGRAGRGKAARRIWEVRRNGTDPKPQRILRAIDIRTGTIKWEVPQPGPAFSWGGTLDGHRPRHLWRGRRIDGCRRRDRRDRVDLQDQPERGRRHR